MRRVLPVILAIGLLAACTPDATQRDTAKANGQGATTTGPTVVGGGPATTVSRPGGGQTRQTALEPRRLPSAGRQPSAETATRSEPAIATPARGGPGTMATVLLRPQPATTVVLEVMHQAGAGPSQKTVDYVSGVLRDVAKKPVDVPAAVALPDGDSTWTAESLMETADAHTKQTQGGGRAVVHALFVRGSFEGKSDVLGVAVRGDLFAVFSDAVDAGATPIVPPQSIEVACATHELGHLLGLVDLVIDTGRADPEHPGHSRNRASVMYWAVESGLVAQLLDGPPPSSFDEADRADLERLRVQGS